MSLTNHSWDLFRDMPSHNVASMNGNDMTEADGDWFITATRIGDGYNRYCGKHESYRDVLAVGGSKLILPCPRKSSRIIPATVVNPPVFC